MRGRERERGSFEFFLGFIENREREVRREKDGGAMLT